MSSVTEKVAVRKKLNLKYTVPAELALLHDELENLRLFASYYGIDSDTLLPEKESNLINRLSLYAQSASAPPDEVEVAEVVEGAKAPETASEIWINNIQKAIDFLADNINDQVNIPLLQQAHKMLVAGTQYSIEGGRMRVEGRNLFTYIEAGVLLPEYDDLQAYIKDVFELVKDKKIPAPIRAFVFFYVFTAIRPFAHENETLAILGAHHILESAKMPFLGLLNLEKHVFFNSKYLVQTAHLFGEQNYLERLDTDLTAYLETCIHRLRGNVAEVKEILNGLVKEEFEYTLLSPRQKNAVNFWLNHGFFMHKEKLKLLTPRQHDILAILIRYSFATTKDLVPVFQVDRKTVQRDFNTLLELGLVDQRGGGRALRYHLDFKILM